MKLNDARIDVVTRRALMLLGAAAVMVLLIACANLAGLLVGRAAARRREIAIRLAIGSGRARFVRQMLIEGGVLAGAAGVLTLLVAAWITPFLRIPTTLARGRNFYGAVGEFATPSVDWRLGRALEGRDRAGSPAVVVINKAAAQRFWPGEDAIGKRVWFEDAAAFGSPEASAEIVGIVGDVAYQPLNENAIQPDFFTASAQFTYPNRMVLVRAAAGEPLALVPQLAQAVRRADPDLALFDVQTVEARAQLSRSEHSFQTALFVIIAVIALSLAAAGVFAVTSFFVTSRSREIGVRMALGADTSRIVRAIMDPTIRFALPGAAAGVLGALLLGRTMRAALYETSHAGVLAGAVSVLIAAVIAATYLPVRRALAVNPVDVLRSE